MRSLGAILALILAVAAPATAQGPRSGPPTGLIVGARGGYDFRANAPLLGAFARASLGSRVAVQATGELTFLSGLTERQYGADLLVRLSPGLALGGGPMMRNSVYSPDGTVDDRESRLGYSVVAQLDGMVGGGRVINGLEFRYSAVDELTSRTLAVQIGLILARW